MRCLQTAADISHIQVSSQLGFYNSRRNKSSRLEIIIYNYDSIINELSQQITKIGSTPIGSYYPEEKTELVKFLSHFLPRSDVRLRGGSTVKCTESGNIVRVLR